MKTLTLAAAIALCLASTAIACGNGECDPEPEPTPTPTPEPTPTPTPPLRTGSDRDDPLPASRRLPCCIKDGELFPMWEPFATDAGTLRRCEAWLARGDALIYECPGHESPEALK